MARRGDSGSGARDPYFKPPLPYSGKQLRSVKEVADYLGLSPTTNEAVDNLGFSAKPQMPSKPTWFTAPAEENDPAGNVIAVPAGTTIPAANASETAPAELTNPSGAANQALSAGVSVACADAARLSVPAAFLGNATHALVNPIIPAANAQQALPDAATTPCVDAMRVQLAFPTTPNADATQVSLGGTGLVANAPESTNAAIRKPDVPSTSTVAAHAGLESQNMQQQSQAECSALLRSIVDTVELQARGSICGPAPVVGIGGEGQQGIHPDNADDAPGVVGVFSPVSALDILPAHNIPFGPPSMKLPYTSATATISPGLPVGVQETAGISLSREPVASSKGDVETSAGPQVAGVGASIVGAGVHSITPLSMQHINTAVAASPCPDAAAMAAAAGNTEVQSTTGTQNMHRQLPESTMGPKSDENVTQVVSQYACVSTFCCDELVRTCMSIHVFFSPSVQLCALLELSGLFDLH